jgi:hypothetical protein
MEWHLLNVPAVLSRKMESCLVQGVMFTVWILYFEFDCRTTFFDNSDIYTEKALVDMESHTKNEIIW